MSNTRGLLQFWVCCGRSVISRLKLLPPGRELRLFYFSRPGSFFVVFGSRQMTSKLHEFHLSLLGKDISPVQSARDLGVILDPNSTFVNHIMTSVSECIARLTQINRVKHCLDKNTLLTVIHALVFSKMYYCSNVWANITSKNVRKLQAVQTFACRIVSGAPLLKSLSWLLAKDQLYYRQAIMACNFLTFLLVIFAQTFEQ